MQIRLENLFAKPLDHFVIESSGFWWTEPCYFQTEIGLFPKTKEASKEIGHGLCLRYHVDAFSKQKTKDQLWKQFEPQFRLIKGQFSSEWVIAFLKLHDEIKEVFEHPKKICIPGGRFVGRKEFVKTDLRTILQEDVDRVDVYVACEERRMGEECFLRMHSSLSASVGRERYLWFEKYVPWRFHREDILPWFIATMNRLPRKARPINLETWQERLLHFEPDLAFKVDNSKKQWTDMPKIILVLGPQGLVGYRALFHLERRNMDWVKQHNEVVTISGRTKLRFVGGDEFVEVWRFHILTDSGLIAANVKRQILSGERIHFGLDVEIVGIIAHEYQRNDIYAINVPEPVIRSLCLSDKQSLRLESPLDQKQKSYKIIDCSDVVL